MRPADAAVAESGIVEGGVVPAVARVGESQGGGAGRGGCGGRTGRGPDCAPEGSLSFFPRVPGKSAEGSAATLWPPSAECPAAALGDPGAGGGGGTGLFLAGVSAAFFVSLSAFAALWEDSSGTSNTEFAEENMSDTTTHTVVEFLSESGIGFPSEPSVSENLPSSTRM